MNVNSKIYLEKDGTKFMGIGVLWLLENIKNNGSLRAASLEMGISYTKAYGMISGLEKALGKQIVIRKKGGSGREGLSLTDFALEFMNLYDSFQKECKNTIENSFSGFMEKLNKLDKLAYAEKR